MWHKLSRRLSRACNAWLAGGEQVSLASPHQAWQGRRLYVRPARIKGCISSDACSQAAGRTDIILCCGAAHGALPRGVGRVSTWPAAPGCFQKKTISLPRPPQCTSHF